MSKNQTRSSANQTRSSAALVVAVVALVAALGGGAVAGVAVTALNKKEKTQVKRISKQQARKLDRQIELLPGPQGSSGDPGPAGQRGPQGVRGPEGIAGHEVDAVTYLDTLYWEDEGFHHFERSCPSGKKALGGGLLPQSADSHTSSDEQLHLGLETASSYPTEDGNSWRVLVRNSTGHNISEAMLRFRVVCADVN